MWAPDWAAERYPGAPPEVEALRQVSTELQRLLETARSNLSACEYEVELLRREAAALRSRLVESEADAMQWRQHQTEVGERRASFYIASHVKRSDEE